MKVLLDYLITIFLSVFGLILTTYFISRLIEVMPDGKMVKSALS